MNPVTATLSSPASELELHSRVEHVLVAGLGLGLAGDYLLRFEPAGPGLCAWLSLLAAAALWLTRHAGAARRRTLLLWSATALAAALLTVVRDLEGLIPAMLLVILVCAVITDLETGGHTLGAARISDYFLHGLAFPLRVLTGALRLLQRVDMGAIAHDPRLPGTVRGVLLAIPVLLVFGALFASADAGFTRYAESVTNVISPRILQHLLLVLVFAWVGTSLLGIGCQKAASASRDNGGRQQQLLIGPLEAHVVLALLSALFVTFVLLQLGYLFGGSEVIVSTSGLTVAEYARRGFFELLVAGALTLGLLLAFGASDCERHVLRRYGTVLIACVLIMLASALQRLFLYTDVFGMTLVRFNALAIMLWQAFNVVSFAFTVLRGRVRGFASALVISGISSLLLLALANPAGVVAKINVERAVQDGHPLDTQYLLLLGADAVPPVLEQFSALNAQQQCNIARGLLAEYAGALDGTTLPSGYDWRRWNLGYARAATAVTTRADELFTAAGVARSPGRLAVDPFMPAC